jgi:long-chain acyl-CoA synthetase
MEPLTERTLKHLLERSVHLYRNRPALGFVDEPTVSYADLQHEVNRMQRLLLELGVVHGDRVAILGESSSNWGVAYFATTTMGAIAVPILPDFHATEVHHIIRHSGCKVVFVSERSYQKIESMDAGTLLALVLLNNLSPIHPKTSKDKLRALIREGGKELRRVRNKALKIAGRIKTGVSEDDVASIIYTSGTTGHSKGVMLTHRNIVWNAEASATIPQITQDDRMLSVLPLAHVYECTLGLVLPVLCGASVTYLRKPPTGAVLLPALASVKPTAMLTVPLIIEKIIKSGVMKEIQKRRAVRLLYRLPVFRRRINRMAGRRLRMMFGGHLRFFGIGGSALSPDAERFLIEAEFPYAIGYGLTETSPLVAGCNAETSRFRAIGPVLPGVEVKIDGSSPGAATGEILVRGPGIMKGYYLDPKRTEEVLSQDGWFRTGDLGSFDRDGYLYIRGRKKNVILGPSGENIYPEAVESVINRFDIVLESLVFSDQGQLVARIVLDYERLDAEFSERRLTESQAKERIRQLLEQIRLHVNEQVSSFSRLARVIEQTEPFEKTPTQKIKRYLYADPGEHRAL